MTTSRAALACAARSARLALTHAGPDRDAFFQLCKAALATVLAGQFALRVIHSATPFYAPMAAFLVVDRTMVRSLWASAQRNSAVVLGMSVAWAVGSVAGVNWWSIGPVIFFALLLGKWSRFGDHGLQVPPTVSRESSTMAGTCRPWSPNRDHFPRSSAKKMTGPILHQLTPATDPTAHATLMPRTTAELRCALAHRERTIVRSTTRKAAIGA